MDYTLSIYHTDFVSIKTHLWYLFLLEDGTILLLKLSEKPVKDRKEDVMFLFLVFYK